MKKQWMLMDAIHGKALQPFFRLAVISWVLQVVVYGIQMSLQKEMIDSYPVLEMPFKATFVISFFILLVLHLRFQQRFIKGGGQIRMQILPTNPSIYIREQTLFIFLTIGIQLVSVYLSIAGIYLLHGVQSSFQEHGMILMILNNGILADFLLPLLYPKLCYLFACIITLTMFYMMLINSLNDGFLLFQNIIIFIILIVLMMSFMLYAQHHTNHEFYSFIQSGVLLLGSAIVYLHMQRVYKLGKIGG